MTVEKLTSPLDPLLALLAHFNSSHDLTQAYIYIYISIYIYINIYIYIYI